MKNTKAFGFAIAAAITLSLLSVSFARPTTTKAETAGLAETRQTAVQSMNNADFAQQNVDLADRSFLDFILSDANFAGNVEYSRSPLYDAELQTSGIQYAFTIGNASGYALLAEIKGENKTFFEVEELFYDKPSPFRESSGLPVYVTHGVYLDYRSGDFYDLKSGDLVEKTLVAEFSERGFGYRGLREFESRYQTVGYASKDVSSYSIQYDLPSYYGTPDSTTCATIAGTIVLGYYDRFYEELIPNYQVYTRLGTRVKYKALSQNILDLSSELYDLMGGEREHLGTTIPNFKTE